MTRANRAPMPELAPVTTATLPSRRKAASGSTRSEGEVTGDRLSKTGPDVQCGGQPAASSSSMTSRASRRGATRVYDVRTHSSTSVHRSSVAGSSNATEIQPWRPRP